MYREVASSLRDILFSTSFDIDDKFGDANESEHSWENISIPEEFVYFFSTLFKLPQTKLFNQYDPNHESNDFKDRKVTKLKALYQIMFYMVHNGTHKIPLHLMVSHDIYEKSKSREVITALNRTGMFVSYNEVMSPREDLARYTIAESKDCHIPLPSQFTKENFAFAAFDNFDHQGQSNTSGKFSNHDTVMTFYQVKEEKTHSKPRKSEIDLANINFKEKLLCQELMSYNSVNKDIVLPSNMIIATDFLDDTDTIKKHNYIKSVVDIVRCLTTKCAETIPTWAGCKSLLRKSKMSLMQVGFLPYLPHPVTEYDTVYTALKNFLNVLEQLDQKSLSAMYDEGVYRIVADIVLQISEEFKNIIPILGGFHMAKALLHCIGKYLKHTGLVDILIQTDTFGIKVVEAVVAGTHYIRSVRRKLAYVAFKIINKVINLVNYVLTSLLIFFVVFARLRQKIWQLFWSSQKRSLS